MLSYADVPEWPNGLASGHPEETASSLVLAQVRILASALKYSLAPIHFKNLLIGIRRQMTLLSAFITFD